MTQDHSKTTTITDFGRLCQAGRTAMTMTRPELATKLHTTAKQISDIERGLATPTDAYVCRVTGILGLDSAAVKNALALDYDAKRYHGSTTLAENRNG